MRTVGQSETVLARRRSTRIARLFCPKIFASCSRRASRLEGQVRGRDRRGGGGLRRRRRRGGRRNRRSDTVRPGSRSVRPVSSAPRPSRSRNASSPGSTKRPQLRPQRRLTRRRGDAERGIGSPRRHAALFLPRQLRMRSHTRNRSPRATLPSCRENRRSLSQPNTVKPRKTTAWFARLAAFITASVPLWAQSTARNDSVVELSPFVVNTNKDTGYQAMSTLAGTRLDTPLTDLGAAISIYTKDFLEDIGATNTNELLIYATGHGGRGPGAGISPAPTRATTSTRSCQSPTTSAKTRRDRPRPRPGERRPSRRDFFIGGIDIDYLQHRAGHGAPRAQRRAVWRQQSRRDRGHLPRARRSPTQQQQGSAAFDNNGGLRTHGRFQPRADPEQARRAARRPRQARRSTTSARPSSRRNGSTARSSTRRSNPPRSAGTSRRAGARPHRPITSPAHQRHLERLAGAGRPGFDWTFYDDPARNPLAASQVLVEFLSPIYMRADAAAQHVHDFLRQSRRPADVLCDPQQSDTHDQCHRRPCGQAAALAPAAQPGPGRRHARLHEYDPNIFEFPAGPFWIGGNVLPGQLPGLVPPGLKQQGFTDFNAFDWKNRLIDETANFFDNFHAFNVSVEQRAWQNRLGIELAYDHQRHDRGSAHLVHQRQRQQQQAVSESTPR